MWKLKHRQWKLSNLDLEQITKFVYRLDGPLGEGEGEGDGKGEVNV
jgi:hypothetical protein